MDIYTANKDNENNGPTSTFDDLLNSFQKESTTRRPQLTTFSDADDIAFLQGLVLHTYIEYFCIFFFLFSTRMNHSLFILFLYISCFSASNCYSRFNNSKNNKKSRFCQSNHSNGIESNSNNTREQRRTTETKYCDTIFNNRCRRN